MSNAANSINFAPADAAKQLRSEIKRHLGFNSKAVSVRAQSFSQGSALHVTIKNVAAAMLRETIREMAEAWGYQNRFIHLNVEDAVRLKVADAILGGRAAEEAQAIFNANAMNERDHLLSASGFRIVATFDGAERGLRVIFDDPNAVDFDHYVSDFAKTDLDAFRQSLAAAYLAAVAK